MKMPTMKEKLEVLKKLKKITEDAMGEPFDSDSLKDFEKLVEENEVLKEDLDKEVEGSEDEKEDPEVLDKKIE